MNHSSKRRGEVKSPEEIAKEDALASQVNAAWDQFIKVRKDWKQSTKSIDELLEYSAKVLAIMSDTSSTINFRQDLLNEKLGQLMIALKEAAKKDHMATLARESADKAESKPETEDKTGDEKKDQAEEKQEPEISEKDKVMDQLKALIKNEMEMLVGLAMKDPKSYQLWHHRKWMFLKIWELETQMKAQGKISKPCVAMDIKICDKFLMKDERNFHAWNYRCFLINYLLERFPDEAIQVLEKELKFLQDKLDSNFSNYSAIHFKTKYLTRHYALSSGKSISDDNYATLSMPALRRELSFVSQGLYIAPYEQSLWIYVGWLIDRKTIVSIIGVDIDDSIVSIDIDCDQAMIDTVSRHLVVDIDDSHTSIECKTSDGKLTIDIGQCHADKIVVRKTIESMASFVMPTTVISIDKSKRATISTINDDDAHAEIVDTLKLWKEIIDMVKDISETEPTNKEVHVNFADLWTKYCHQTKSLSTAEVDRSIVDVPALIERLKNIRQTTSNHALLDCCIDSLSSIVV